MNQKLYFNNNKSLVVCVNYALLGFYLCHFRRHESRFNSVQLKTYQTKKISCLTYNNAKFVSKRIKINYKK